MWWRLGVADHSKVFIIDAVVGWACETSCRVVDNGNFRGINLGYANIYANVAAWTPLAMWCTIGEGRLEYKDRATKDVVVLGS